jgi:thiol:disulfide interchange protein
MTTESRRSCLVALLLLIAMPPCIAGQPKLPGYDAKANPEADLNRALAEARKSNKKVLVIAGGDWCVWCHYLEAFVKKNKDVDDALHGAFVTVKVYVGNENKNAEFFSRLPKAIGYPHFWVLENDGKLKKSVNTALLEDGKTSYNKATFLKFIRDMAG